MLWNEGGEIMREVELLSPAKNLECGIAAINHGADAVYIGGPSFGARVAAGNSFEDLEKLVRYAHPYHAKVFVTLNTILTDRELEEAERQICQYYNLGIDALIVQDMGLLKLNLPPIALHASTQCDNRTIDKVRFLQNSGFQRVVLARELSLSQMKTIHGSCDIELEAFVHGALCVSYSGRCYMSQAACGRSANRGECAQYCRLPYSLQDGDGKIIMENKHLLSLKDLDRSDYIEDMMDAGISSFKIEGRLKDVDYVKNVTAFYRQKFDNILEGKDDFKAASLGKTTFFFQPDPERTFHRGKTSYFIDGKRDIVAQIDTPKSTGSFVGSVLSVSANSFVYSQDKPLHNGDGLCFFDKIGNFDGFRVNKVEGNRVFPNEMPNVKVGDRLFRNYDIQFEKELEGKSAERYVAVDFELAENEDGFIIRCCDESGTEVELSFSQEKMMAAKPEKAIENVKNQLSKLGNTCYKARNINILTKEIYFIPNSVLTESRRQIIELLLCEKIKQKLHKKVTLPNLQNTNPIEADNVYNQKAFDFYRNNGIENIKDAYEKEPKEDEFLMTCKHCIRFQIGACKKSGRTVTLKEPLTIQTGNLSFRLSFDCAKCEMMITGEQ